MNKCASSIQPTYGRLGLAISGLRPNRLANTNHRKKAAHLSATPARNSSDAAAAAITTATTKPGVSARRKMFANTPNNGLWRASGSMPSDENNSQAHGAR